MTFLDTFDPVEAFRPWCFVLDTQNCGTKQVPQILVLKKLLRLLLNKRTTGSIWVLCAIIILVQTIDSHKFSKNERR